MQLNNYTQISNEFIDNMSKYSGSAVKVFMAISRKTIGWHKNTDRIAYSQLQEITGLSVNSLKKGIFELKKDKWILQFKSLLGYKYDLNISNNDIHKKEECQKLIEPVSKIDIEKPESISKIDTTKDNNINKLTKEKQSLFKEIQDIYNKKLLLIYKQQSIINNLIFKNKKELSQNSFLIKKLEEQDTPVDFSNKFFETAFNITWLKEPSRGFLPSILISQFSQIQSAMYLLKENKTESKNNNPFNYTIQLSEQEEKDILNGKRKA